MTRWCCAEQIIIVLNNKIILVLKQVEMINSWTLLCQVAVLIEVTWHCNRSKIAKKLHSSGGAITVKLRSYCGQVALQLQMFDRPIGICSRK